MPHYPLGAPIPNSAHAVCSSLPDMHAVIGYEEKEPAVMKKLKSGYPRFLPHPYVVALGRRFLSELDLEDYGIALLNSDHSGARLAHYIADSRCIRGLHHDIAYVAFPDTPRCRKRAKDFLQHTGCGISSRQAEQLLVTHGLLKPGQAVRETRNYAYPEHAVREAIALHSGVSEDCIRLTNSGMNAFYAAFKVAETLQAESGKHIWIQLGWLYLDTSHVIHKLGAPHTEVMCIVDARDTQAIQDTFRRHAGRIAGIITEAPTNPLVQTADLSTLRELCDQENALLIVDPTLASLANVDVTAVADIIVTSLTKYAANEGDVLLGAVMPGVIQPWTARWLSELHTLIEPPFVGDLARLAAEIFAWPSVTQTINRNCRKLARFLERHRAVRAVYWAEAAQTHPQYAKIRRQGGGPGSIISIFLRRPDRMPEVYARLAIAKGPSFGTRFSICCPFMYLAHYDLVSNCPGRDHLWQHGLDPELLRISVGTEDIDELIHAFDVALAPLLD